MRQDRRRRTGSGGRSAILTLVAIIGTLSLAALGWSQDKPVSPVGPYTPVQVQPGARPAAGHPTTQASSGCGDKSAAAEPTPSPTGPHPRWVVKEQKVTAEPVWRGKSVEFEFEVANEGEADLLIRLKGK